MSNIEDMLSGKERLEFGNKELCEAIDRQEQREKEEKEGLKKYQVVFHHSGCSTVWVEAHDEEEAKEKANDEKDDEMIEWQDIEHIEVILMKGNE